MGNLVGMTAKEVVVLTIQKLAEGKKFNEIEIPGGETIEHYVGRQRSFLKVIFLNFHFN